MIAARFLLCSALLSVASAFTLPVVRTTTTTLSAPVLGMAGDNQQDEDFMRWARASRTASSDDNVVELSRPLGLVLNQDDKGNVFVETVAPKGNAARTGKVGSLVWFVRLASIGCHSHAPPHPTPIPFSMSIMIPTF
jgi:hypothetical protein